MNSVSLNASLGGSFSYYGEKTLLLFESTQMKVMGIALAVLGCLCYIFYRSMQSHQVALIETQKELDQIKEDFGLKEPEPIEVPKEKKLEHIQEEAKRAAEGDRMGPGCPYTIFNDLCFLINHASLEEIPYVINGVRYHTPGLSAALAELLMNREKNEEFSKEKLILAIRMLSETELFDAINVNQEWYRNYKIGIDTYPQIEQRYNSFLFDEIKKQRLDLLLKYKDELSLSAPIVRIIEDILKQTADLNEATKNLPQMYWE